MPLRLSRQHCRRCGAIKKGHVCRVTDDEYFRTDRQLACGPNRPTVLPLPQPRTWSPPRRRASSSCPSPYPLPSLPTSVCVCVPPAGVLRERRTIAPPSYLAKEADETSEELSSMKRSSRGKKSDRALREESDKALRCAAPSPHRAATLPGTYTFASAPRPRSLLPTSGAQD